MMSKKRLIISIIIMIFIGLFAILLVFGKALQPTKAQMYAYQVKNYVGDMQVNESKRIDWIYGSEVLVIRTNSSADIRKDYRAFVLNKDKRGDKYFYFMRVTESWVDSFGYCGFSSTSYTYKQNTVKRFVYCNASHAVEWSRDYPPILIYDLEGMSIKFKNMKLDKPFYKVSSDGYLTLSVVEF